ncbi:heterodisulfide reductase subunit F [candidate division WOR-3 bacterium]|nr:heterodisulfide reductase subunit F [candidate division WOR-3 bacterium]
MPNPYLPISVKVERVTVENEAKDLKTFDLSFVEPGERKAFEFIPGQFGFLSIAGVGEAPFGIASAPSEPLVRYTVKRVGAFTTALHELEEGTVIGMRGPWGNSYPLDLMQGRDVVIVSGGFSFTTLRSTIVHLLDPKRRSQFGKLTCVYGARSAGELLYKEEIKAWESNPDISLHLCVDKLGGDPWPGTEGLVPNVLKQVAPSAKNAVALVCGPPIMIRFTHPVLEELGFKPDNVFLSLENRMKCGIGKCGHCNIGPVYVCKDGPVFSYSQLKNLPAEY